MAKPVRISLANKCQLLFGAAVVLILASALMVGWLRMRTLVLEGQKGMARMLAQECLEGSLPTDTDTDAGGKFDGGLTIERIHREDFEARTQRDPFLKDAIGRFLARQDQWELFRPATDSAGVQFYRYVRSVRKSDLARRQLGAGVDTYRLADPLEEVILIQLGAGPAQQQLLLNRIYIVAAGLLAGLLAIGAFWFITTRIILAPVRVLRDTAQQVSTGDLNIRSDINTGDEFEQLSESFNAMLDNLKQNADQLRSINKSLDLKLGELAESNVHLFEANKIKGEFLANVSHELRTPLNSIIGFAEVLEETLKDRTGPVDEKRKRYTANIIASSRRLLDMINELLDLAKIEAGRVDVHVAPMSVADTIEGLVNLMKPQAEKGQIILDIKAAPEIPLVHTDAGKFQQILFNFLSNAVKFTPPGGTITVAASVLAPPATPDSGAPAAAPPPPPPRVCVSVTDTGPGIPRDQHEKIFEKFTQLDATVTKEYAGTGLGLAISKELARLLQGQIEVDSDTGRGATFSLIIPLSLESKAAPLMPAPASAQAPG